MSEQPYVAGIWIYPVKSCQGIQRKFATIGKYGFQHDHCCMVAGAEDGSYCSQKKLPQMALIGTRISEKEEFLELQVPGAEPIRVPLFGGDGPRLGVTVYEDRLIAMDQGPRAAEILSDFLGKKVRLVRIAPEDRRRSPGGNRIAFHDRWQVMAMSLAGLDPVGEWTGKKLDMRQFRPQLVLGGCPSFWEDTLARARIGNAVIIGRDHCYRCTIPDVNLRTGEQEKGIFAALSQHRGCWHEPSQKRRAYLGRNFDFERGSWIEEGEIVRATRMDGGLIFDPPGFRPPKQVAG